MRQYLHNLWGQAQPRYHELTAYLTALTCGLLFLFYPEFRQGYFDVLQSAMAVVTLIATLGFLISLIEVFLARKKIELEKTAMSVFVMAASGFTGIAAGVEMLPARGSILMFIPAWNVLVGVILLYQIGLAKFDVSDENASGREVLWASIILLILFGIAKFQFHLTWAMTFSICMFYASTLSSLVNWTINYFHLQPLSET